MKERCRIRASLLCQPKFSGSDPPEELGSCLCTLNLENVESQKGLLDNLNHKLMAKIVAEVIRKLQGSGSGKYKKENKFFDQVTKWNPKTYDGKDDRCY